jgi:predicted DsbA family dithiol-disulfide isomerase
MPLMLQHVHICRENWPYADLLFKDQGKLESAKLYEYAEEVGLDMEIFKHCMESGRGKKFVDADIAEGNELGIFTTPGFFFNGHFVRGLPKPRQIQLILDQYLPKPDKQKPKD